MEAVMNKDVQQDFCILLISWLLPKVQIYIVYLTFYCVCLHIYK